MVKMGRSIIYGLLYGLLLGCAVLVLQCGLGLTPYNRPGLRELISMAVFFGGGSATLWLLLFPPLLAWIERRLQINGIDD